MPIIENRTARNFSSRVLGHHVLIVPNGSLLVPQSICDNELFREHLAQIGVIDPGAARIIIPQEGSLEDVREPDTEPESE